MDNKRLIIADFNMYTEQELDKLTSFLISEKISTFFAVVTMSSTLLYLTFHLVLAIKRGVFL